jgi:nicotinamidase-related amidase
MPAQLSFDPAHSAVLCMDYQTGIVSIYIKDQDLLPRVASVLNQSRSAGRALI